METGRRSEASGRAAQKEATRRQILEAAAIRLRRDGLASLGVKSVMSEAGLTHGGFYAHFANRDALLAAALTVACEQTGRLYSGWVMPQAEERVSAFIDAYLSRDHVDDLANGCTLAAIGGEVVRESAAARLAFEHGAIGLATDLTKAFELPQNAQMISRTRMLLGVLAGLVQLRRADHEALPHESAHLRKHLSSWFL